MAGGLKGLIEDLTPPAKEGKAAQRKYIQFSLEEWNAMEKAAGAALETSDVKILVQGIFSGKVNLTKAK